MKIVNPLKQSWVILAETPDNTKYVVGSTDGAIAWMTKEFAAAWMTQAEGWRVLGVEQANPNEVRLDWTEPSAGDALIVEPRTYLIGSYSIEAAYVPEIKAWVTTGQVSEIRDEVALRQETNDQPA